MANSGPSSDVKLGDVDTTARPVRLSQEPTGAPGASTSAPVAPVDDNTVPKGANGTNGDPDLRQKLLAAGALIAAGVAIVLSVRHFQGGDDSEECRGQRTAKRKVKEGKHAVKEAGEQGKNILEDAGEKISDAASATSEKAKEVVDTSVEKAQELQQDAKEALEKETRKADERAASPEAELEQRRMTYGEDKHGKPKGLTEDAGFLGFRNWWPGAKRA